MNGIITDEFFILDSENLEKVESKLYGYVITDFGVVFDYKNVSSAELSGNGAYVLVDVDSDNICISQDFIGSYGLYLFEEEGYFALSNSFVKLEEFLKEKFELSFNYSFAEALLSTEKSSFVFKETLINEISLIPRNNKIEICISNRKLEFVEDFPKQSFDLYSREGMSYLDDWFNKWIIILRNIIKESNNFFMNLTDYSTSFVLIAMLLNSGINLKNIYINANLNKGNSSKESEVIYSIAQDFNFIMGSDDLKGLNIDNINIPLDFSFHTKLGFKKQYGFSNVIYNKYFFSVNNQDLTIINNNPISNIEDFIENTTINAKKYSARIGANIEKYIWDNVHAVQKQLKIYDIFSPYFCEKYFKETMFRNEFGKNNVEDYLTNKININPLSDSCLRDIKIKDIVPLIILRYSPDLLNYINSDLFDEETLRIAKKVNEDYPYERKDFETIEGKSVESLVNPKYNLTNDIHDFLIKIFYSNSFKHTFLKYFSEEVYKNVTNFYLERNNHFYAEVYSIISFVKILEDIEYSKYKNYKSEIDWIESFIVVDNKDNEIKIPFDEMLTKYYTARIDIKNKGSFANQIKIFDISDNIAEITSPAWFINEQGHGKCVISAKGEISFKIKCINDGDLHIELRTLDITDRNNRRFPVYIDYLSFKIDDTEYLKENTLAWHNDPIQYNKKVIDGEIIKINLKWQPFTKISKYE